jgi:hypothetical protein
MEDLINSASRFFERGGVWWGIGISAALAVISLGLATAVVLAWPADHFRRDRLDRSDTHFALRVLALVGKNLLGLVVFLLGLVMALPGIPGQGLLTMVIGITLLDFPGKRELERRLIAHPRILRSINRLRARFNRAPLELG